MTPSRSWVCGAVSWVRWKASMLPAASSRAAPTAGSMSRRAAAISAAGTRRSVRVTPSKRSVRLAEGDVAPGLDVGQDGADRRRWARRRPGWAGAGVGAGHGHAAEVESLEHVDGRTLPVGPGRSPPGSSPARPRRVEGTHVRQPRSSDRRHLRDGRRPRPSGRTTSPSRRRTPADEERVLALEEIERRLRAALRVLSALSWPAAGAAHAR